MSISLGKLYLLNVLCLMFFVGCIAGNGSKKTVECGKGSAFNAVERDCIGAQVKEGPVTPTFDRMTIQEDSGANVVELTYTDAFDDLATGCSIVSYSSSISGDGASPVSCSCVGGYCSAIVVPNNDFFGAAEFIYNITDEDGTSLNKLVSVTVEPINDAPVGENGALTLAEDTDLLSANFPASMGKTVGSGSAFDFYDVEDGANICYELVTGPTHGTVTFNSDCTFNYVLVANYNGPDSFTFRITDTEGGASAIYTVNVTVTADAGDAPVAVLNSIADFNEDDYANGGVAIALTWSDPDNVASVFDEPELCRITATTNVYVVGTCTCVGADAAATCSVTIKGLPNKFGAGSFTYELEDTTAGSLAVSSSQTVNFNIISGDDDSSRIMLTSAGDRNTTYSIPLKDESSTSVADDLGFTLDPPYHPDSSTLSYAVLTAPKNGTLSNCLGESGSSSSDLTCDYSPNDGNLNGLGVHASAQTGDANILFTSRIPGTFGNDVSVELIHAASLGNGNEVAWLENDKDIKVHMESTVSTVDNVIAAINANEETKALVVPSILTLGTNTVTAGASFTLSSGTSGVAPMDSFIIRVTDSDGDASDVEIPITITAVDDTPVVCEYTPFEEARECGLAGCIGMKTPEGRITVPSGSTYYYYDKTSGTCWQGTSSSWSVVSSHIRDHAVNEENIITIDRIIMDEGGGDSAEDIQSVMITSIISSNSVLIPVANIRAIVDNTVLATGLSSMPINLGSLAVSDDTLELKIELQRQGNNIGTSTITLSFCDSTDGVNCLSTPIDINFDVSINNISVQHGGWLNIGGVGPKVDKYGKLPEDARYCPLSRALCESGLPCSGSGTPVGNSNADPDDIDAIYLDTSSNSCYRFDQNSLTTTIEGMQYVSRTPSGASLELQDDTAVTAGSEVVTVTGDDVLVKIDAGNTTVDQLMNALRASTDAIEKIKFWPVESGQLSLGVSGIGASATLTVSGVNYIDQGAGSSIALTDNPAVNAGGEIVTVAGTNITVDIDSGNTTGSQIARAINTHEVAKGVINVTLNYSTTVSASSKASLNTFSNADWIEFSTKDTIDDNRVFCDITPYEYDSGCQNMGASCQGYGNPYKMKITPVNIDSRYWDSMDNVCFKSIDSDKDGSVDSWDRYYAPSSITLQWNDFTVNGGGSISSYNVYRRLSNESFDYHRPINQDPVSVLVKKFVDNAENSWIPATSGTVYHYEVRPVVNSLATDSSESFKKARVLSPPENKVFVHRWIVNQEVCKLMHQNTDPLNSFRCNYEGPGDSRQTGGTNYYDIGRDLLVDTYEAGCPYTGHAEARPCSTSGGTCLGLQDPVTASVTAQVADGNSFTHAIYYSRSDAKCWETTDGTNWSEIDGTNTFPFAISIPRLPPLTNIDQTQANSSCVAMNSYDTSSINGITAAATLSHRLPHRKEQIAYSLWDSDFFTDTTITTLETGLSINSSSKCNSSSASGLESGYTDNDIPNSAVGYSLPGSETSGIRSMMTGSTETKDCVGRFGVQDHVGNVAEWAFDRVYCNAGDYTCTGVSGNSFAGLEFGGADSPDDYEAGLRDDAGGSGYLIFALDGVRGPCVDANSDGTCDSFLDYWTIDLENNNAGRFFVPMGLPVHVDFNSTSFSTSNVAPYALEIGPTSGITANQLHDDVIKTQTQFIYSEDQGCGGVAAGGDYTDGVGGGTWNFKFLPCSEPLLGYFMLNDVMFKDMNGAATLTLQDPAAASSPLSINVVSPNVTVNLATDAGGNIISTTADVAAAINADGVANLIIFSYVVGPLSSNIVSPISQTTINGATTTTLSKNEKVGFRCVVPIEDNYYED